MPDEATGIIPITEEEPSPELIPPVEIPEYYAGFGKEFEQMGVELQQAYQRLQLAEQKLTQPLYVQAFAGLGGFGWFMRTGLKMSPLTYIIEALIPGEAKQEAMKVLAAEAAAEFDAAAHDFQVSEWKLEIMNAVPFYISDPFYAIEKPEDILKYVAPGTELSDADTAWLNQLYGRLEHLSNVLPEDFQGDVLESQSMIINKILSEPKVELKGVHRLTVDEIAKAFTFGVTELPANLTAGDVRGLLSEFDLDEEMKNQREWLAERAKEWELEAARMNLIKAGTILAETPELAPLQWAKLIVTQPMMAVVEVMQMWWDKISRPISAAITMNLPAPVAGAAHGVALGAAVGGAIGSIVPGIGTAIGAGIGALIGTVGGAGLFAAFETDADKELTVHYEFYRGMGESAWSSYAKAFNEWDAPWWKKMILDSAYDPLMWLGWGGVTAVGSKLTKMALPRGLKWVGSRIGTLAIAVEQGYVAGADAVFRAGVKVGAAPLKSFFWLTGAGYTIPATFTQMSRNFAKQGVKDFFAVAGRTYRGMRGKVGVGMTGKDANELVEACIRSALDNPMQGMSPSVRLGTSVMEFGYLDDIAAAKFLRGLVPADTVLDTSRLARLNSRLLDAFSGQIPSTGKPMNRIIAGEIFSDLLIEPTTKQITTLATGIGKFKDSVAKKAIEAFKGETADGVIKKLYAHLELSRYNNLHSPLTKYMQQAGRSASWHSRVADKVLYSARLVQMERKLVMPVARWQLLFTNFGPYNYLENDMRSFLGGAEIMKPHAYSGVDETIDLLAGCSNIDYGLLMAQKGQRSLTQAVVDPSTGATAVYKGGRVPLVTSRVRIPEKIPRWGGKYIGKTITIGDQRFFLGSAQDWYDMWSYLVTNQAAYDTQVHFIKSMWELYPEQMKGIRGVMDDAKPVLDDITSISKREAFDIDRELELSIIGGGPESARQFADVDVITMQRRAIKMKLNRDTWDKMYDVHRVIKEGVNDEILDGRMFVGGHAGVDGRIDAFKEASRELDIASLAPQMDSIKDDVAGLIANPPRNLDDFMGDMQQITTHIEAFGETVHDFRKITRARVARLLGTEVDDFEAGSAKMLAEYMNVSDDELTKMMSQLMKNARTAGLSDVQIARLTDLDSITRLEFNNVLATRTKIASIEAEIPDFHKSIRKLWRTDPDGAATRSRAFWDSQKSRKADIWDDFDEIAGRLKGNRLLASRNFLTSVDKPVFVPDSVPEVVGKLTPNHLAHLYGCTGDDLYRGLTRIHRHTRIRPRRDFIIHTKDHANAYAAKFGKTAEQLGFTDEAIGEVYDQMWKNLGIDPAILMPDSPTMLQMEEVRQEIHRLYGSTKIPDSDVIKWRQYINGVADEAGQLSQFKAPPAVMGAGTVKSRITYPQGRRTTFVTVSDKGKVTASIEYYDMRDVKGIAIDMIQTKPDALRKGYATRALNEVLDDAESRGLTLYSGAATADGMKFFKGLKRKGLITLEKTVEEGQTFVIRRAAAPAVMETGRPFTSTVYRGTKAKGLAPTDEGLVGKAQYWSTSRDYAATYGTVKESSITLNNPLVIRSQTEWDDFAIRTRGLRDIATREGRSEDWVQVALRKQLEAEGYDGVVIAKGIVEPGAQVAVFYPEKAVGVAPPPRVPPTEPAISGMPEWYLKKERALEKAKELHYLAYPNYEDANVIDETMRAIFPFWNYELFRWKWLPRTFMRTPGVMSGLARYMTYTDQGYMPVPGTDLQINPLRGTVFMGGLRSFYLRDFPEFHDAAPGIEFLDYIGRAGFFPGVHVMLPIILFGAGDEPPQFGQLAPAWVKTGLSALRILSPEHIGNVLEIVYPDRFRDYMAMMQLGSMGYDADEIWNKKQQGIKLTEEEEKLWLQAVNKVDGIKGILMNQTGLFRIRPAEFSLIRKEMRLAIEEATGVPVETQDWIDKMYPVTGKRFSDYFHLDIQQQALIYQWESFRRYQGITTPLYPSSWQALDIKVRDYYKELEDVYNESRYLGRYEDGELVQPSIVDINRQLVEGVIGPSQWRSIRNDIQNGLAEAVRILGDSPAYKDVPKTFEERCTLLEERGVVTPTQTPDQELMYYYFELKPELKYNWESERMELDYNTYYAYIDILLESLAPPFRERLMDRIQNNWTPMERLYWEFSRTYARPYRNIRDIVLREYSDEDVKIIRRFEVARGTEREEILEVIGPDGKLISGYKKKLRDARQRLRMLDPELDAWLYFFGTTDKLMSHESREMYDNLVKRYLVPTMIGEAK